MYYEEALLELLDFDVEKIENNLFDIYKKFNNQYALFLDGYLDYLEKNDDNIYEIGEYHGILIKGEKGCGRHTLANGIAKTIDNDDLCYVIFDGSVLKKYEYDQMKMAIFNNMDFENDFCVIVDNIEQCDYIGELIDIWESKAGMRTFWIFISNEENVPDYIINDLLMCKCDLPDKEERKVFFTYSYNVIEMFDYIDPNHIIELSEGLTYSQMYKLIDMLKISKWLFKRDIQNRDLDFVVEKSEIEKYVKLLKKESYSQKAVFATTVVTQSSTEKKSENVELTKAPTIDINAMTDSEFINYAEELDANREVEE